ncbi:transposase [Streptomyces noursei]|uniref:transposase n=1 Tax=Streptomyces noursei TaxID=1971 RepID=UPI0022BB91AC|nr:transposase [Streptomyces noursei]
MAGGDLTDTQWAWLEPLLPGLKPGRPPIWTRCQLIDGTRFRTRIGVPWRDVPERYGRWARAYHLFRRWQQDGHDGGGLEIADAKGVRQEIPAHLIVHHATWDLLDETARQPPGHR